MVPANGARADARPGSALLADDGEIERRDIVPVASPDIVFFPFIKLQAVASLRVHRPEIFRLASNLGEMVDHLFVWG